MRISLDEARDRFGTAHWGAGYFDVSPEGDLLIRPGGDGKTALSLPRIVEQWRASGGSTPLLLRFPQILESQLQRIESAFERAFDEFGYRDHAYSPVFPIKVNQQRFVVETLLGTGRQGAGLEVGSRAELLAALCLEQMIGRTLLLNGYKDAITLDLAVLAQRMGMDVTVIIEKHFEVDPVLRAFERAGSGPLPKIGVRARLSARGSGRWWKSSGATAKFGLSAHALLLAVETIRARGHLDRLHLLHFHIGSQVPAIRRFKVAFKEGARIYAKLRRAGVPLDVFDVGGGLAVDYDGSGTASDASMNYGIEEYANDIVYTLRDICREEEVPQPRIISESGRALSAHHALLVADVIGGIHADSPQTRNAEDVSSADLVATIHRREQSSEDPPRALAELLALRKDFQQKTYREFYHDALELRDELAMLFDVGLLSLEDRALGEQLFWDLAKRSLVHARKERALPAEFEQLERALHEKYIVNFSVFQSMPDHWALDQVFPVIPTTRLREEATSRVSLVDITCDSDGEITRYADPQRLRETLDLHSLPAPSDEQPYDLAFLMLGAYQDVMGDLHNLFGPPDEIAVRAGDDGDAEIVGKVTGQSAGKTLDLFGYDAEACSDLIERRLSQTAADTDVVRAWVDLHRKAIESGGYLRKP